MIIFESLFVDFLVVVAIVTALLYRFSTSTFHYWKCRGVPYLSPIPLFGNMKEFVLLRMNINQLFEDFHNRFEGRKYGGIFIMRHPGLMLRDPETIKSVLVKDFKHFHDRGIFIPKKQTLGHHLFSLAGPQWRALRTKLTPTFTTGKMKLMMGAIAESSRRLQEYVEPLAAEGRVVELKDVMSRFSIDVIGSCAFGLEANAITDQNSEFRRMGRKFFTPSMPMLLLRMANIFAPRLARYFDADDMDTEVSEFFLRVVKETVQHRVANGISRNDFLQQLIYLKQKSEVEMLEMMDDSDAEDKGNGNGYEAEETLNGSLEMDDGLLAAQAFVFFIAGFDTVSTTLSFALHELAVNVDVQTRLREEIVANLQDCNGTITYDALMNMAYLDKVISETLRKYPPAPTLIREVTEPYLLPESSVELEVGTKVLISIGGLHHDPEYYPDPERFDPERFSEKNKAKRPPCVYLPFGEGPRHCIGMRFGQLQTKMALLALLHRFQFHVSEDTEVPIRIDPRAPVTGSISGTLLRITKIE